MAAPFRFNLFDPTFLFVLVCALVPALKDRDPNVLLEFATDKGLLAIAALTAAVIVYARSGKQAELEAWEQRAGKF